MAGPWPRAFLGEEDLLEASVAEIHAYPPRPEGFEEPLFPTRDSRVAVAEHLLEAPWLSRASELAGNGGRTVHARREPVEFGGGPGTCRISWTSNRRGRRKRCRVVEVFDHWREVGWWWDESTHVDHLVLRVLLSDRAVASLAREAPGRWFLVGIED